MTSRSDAEQPHRPCPCTRSEFSRRANRKPSSITEACAGPLLAACIQGGRIDANHPATRAWAAKRGIDPVTLLDPVARQGAANSGTLGISNADTAKTTPPEGSSGAARTSRRGRGRPKAGEAPATSSDTDHSQPADVSDLLSCTLLELTTRHGSAQGFSDWLETRKQIAETARLESRNDRDAARLISAELVKLHVFGMIEGQNRRLLTNAPRTIAIRALSAARNGAPLEQLTALVTGAISTELRVSVTRARRAIRACKTGDNPPELSPPAETKTANEIHAFAHDLTTRLRADAVPIVIDFLLAEVARAACGETWNRAMAEQVIATKTALASEAARVVGNMLAAHVSHAVTDALTQENKTT